MGERTLRRKYQGHPQERQLVWTDIGTEETEPRNVPSSPGTPEQTPSIPSNQRKKRFRDHGSNGGDVKIRKSPELYTMHSQSKSDQDLSSSGSTGGETKRSMWSDFDDYCSGGLSSSGSKGGKALRSTWSDIDCCSGDPGSSGSTRGKAKRSMWLDIDDYCNGGPGFSDTKEEEPKINTPFDKGPNNPGSEGGKVKRCKWSDMVTDGPCKSYEGPSSPGTTAEEPNFGTFFIKLPLSPGSLETVFESATR